MQLKDFVSSKKVLFAGIAATGLVVGAGAGLAYQSAHGQQSNQTSALQNYKSIVPQKSPEDNGVAAVSKVPAAGKSSAKKSSTSTANAACLVKAETNTKGQKVFYLPNMRGYAKIPATNCFKTAELAAAAGYKSATAK